MYKTLLASAVGLVLSANTMADSYQFEGAAHYLTSQENTDDVDSLDTDGLFASGTYYFAPVKTDNHPLREAAFLEKSSSVSLAYSYVKETEEYLYRSSSFRYQSTDTDKFSSVAAAAESYFFNKLIYVGAYASHGESKYSTTEETFYTNSPSLNSRETYSSKDSDDQWRFNLGVAPIDGLLIWSEFSKDVHVNHSWNLNAKYVLEFKGSALNLQGGVGQDAIAFLGGATIYPANLKSNFSGFDNLDIDAAYILGDYYFDNTFSLGLGATHADAKEYELDDTYMIRTQKFFNNSFSLLAQYVIEETQDSYSIGASIRF